MSKIIVLIGPTSSGKTKLSIELAKYLDAQIINADAVQIYKEVNIGTSKISKNDMQGIKHHLIDFYSLKDKKYTVYDYQKAGRKILNDLIQENKNVIVVGGTGLYIKALLYDYELTFEINKNVDYEKYSNEELKNMVDEIDKLNNIHSNNRKRMIRFLNYYSNTGKILSNLRNKNKALYDFKIIGLNIDRESLYNQINLKVDEMFEHGLLNEAKSLYEEKTDTDYIIGYKELNDYFKNKYSLDEAKEQIKKNTRRYAKRQMTWNKSQFDNVSWLDVDYKNFNETIKKAINLLQ